MAAGFMAAGFMAAGFMAARLTAARHTAARLTVAKLSAAGLAAAGLAAAAIAAPSAAAAQAGGFCADPQAFCQRFISPACGARFGAGALAAGEGADAGCAGQIEAYRTCLSAAAETCAAPGGAVEGRRAASPAAGCDAEDARGLWAELRESRAPGELEAFAEACAGRPQAALARARAARLRAGTTAPSAAPDAHVGQESPSAAVGGVVFISSSDVRLRAAPSLASDPSQLRGYVAPGSVARVLERGAEGRFVKIDVLRVAPGLGLPAARGWVPASGLRAAPRSAAPAPLAVGSEALVEAYTISLAPRPGARDAVLGAKGWVKQGSRVSVRERFVDAEEGVFIRFRLIDVVAGSQPKADEAWTPEANLKPAL